MNAAQVRRMSSMPAGNTSRTDTDIHTLPRAREMLRNSTPIAPGYTPSYAAISSNESLPRRQVSTKAPKAILSNRAMNDSDAHQRSYPSPRRLTRSNIIPLKKVKAGDSSSVPEPPVNFVKQDPAQATDDRRTLPRSETEPRFANQVHVPTGAPRSDLLLPASLEPKPLSINKQRSVSFGTLPTPPQRVKKPVGLYVVDSRVEAAQQEGLSLLPRSTSLCAQQPGQVPTEPVPPLPLNITPRRPQSVRCPTEQRGSGKSLLSGDTSGLDDESSGCFSKGETDHTSLSLISPLTFDSARLEKGAEKGYKWESEHLAGTISPTNAFKQVTARPQLQTQHSFRASIQQTLPRSSSSGLSMSLLDQTLSRNTSSTTVNKDRSPVFPRTVLKIPRGIDKMSLARSSTCQSSPLSRRPMFNIHEDVKSKRASAVLQTVSGNEGSPLHDEIKSRPLSIATSNPFKWEQGMSLRKDKPLSIQGKLVGHKRRNCVRISNIPIYVPSPGGLHTTAEEQDDLAKNLTNPRDDTNPTEADLRPLSRTTFDPQLTPTPAPRPYRLPKMQASPTFTDIKLHSPVSYSSSPSSLSTPTNKPSNRRPSGAHANRRRPIFDIPSSSEFAFITLEKPAPPTLAVKPAADPILKPVILPGFPATDTPSPDTETNVLGPRPSSTLFPFPSPPHPPAKAAPNWRSPVRGPRAIPPTAWRRSPTSVAKISVSGSVAYPVRASNPRMDLRKIVGALRRMDSEASRLERSDSSAKAHQMFTCLDDDGKVNFFDVVDKENDVFRAGDGVEWNARESCVAKRERSETCKAFERVLNGPREMPRRESGTNEGEESRMGRDWYDERGFLRD
ncbi:MAG: hypothetical protein Q9191_006705 [Dirinaria sp. TL-2023a]